MTSVKNRFRAAVLGLIAAQRADALKLNMFQNQHHGNDGHDSDTHTEYAVVEEGDGIHPTVSCTSSAADDAGEPIWEDVTMDDAVNALMSRMALNEHFTPKGVENSKTNTNTHWGRVRAFVRNTKDGEKDGTISDHISTSTFNTPDTIPYSPPTNVEDADAMEIVEQLGDRLSGVSLSVAQDSPRPLSPTQSVSRSPSRWAFDNIRLRGSGSGENMVKLGRQDSDEIGFRGFLKHWEGYWVPAVERADARVFEQKHAGRSDDIDRSVSSSPDNAVKREREGVEKGVGLDNYKSQKRGYMSCKENPTGLIKKEKTSLKRWEVEEAENAIFKSSSPVYEIDYDMHNDKEGLSQGVPNAASTTVHKANVMVAYKKKLDEIKDQEETVQNRENRVNSSEGPHKFSTLPIQVQKLFEKNLQDAKDLLGKMKKEFADLNQKRLDIVEQWVLRNRAENQRKGRNALRTIR